MGNGLIAAGPEWPSHGPTWKGGENRDVTKGLRLRQT